MDALPIKLNFFKRAEQFLEILALDRQFDLMTEKYDLDEANKDMPHYGVSLNLSSWNIEKKILYWSFLNHKHLGSPISVEYLEKESFQQDIKTSNQEIKFANPQNILNNLVIHGFADDSDGVKLSPNGLLAGSLIYDAYIFKEEKKLDFGYLKLVPLARKKIGYYLFYLTSWLLILETISFLGFQTLSIAGLIDNLKDFLPKTLSFPLVMLALSPLFTLLLGLLLISFSIPTVCKRARRGKNSKF